MNYKERISALENRVAFQEDALDKLSDVIARQDQCLVTLERQIKYLHEQLKKFDHPLMADADIEPPPPHY